MILRMPVDRWHRWTSLVILLPWLVPVAARALESAEPDERSSAVTLVAGRVMQPDGSLQPGQAVVVRDGTIKRVASENETEGQAVRRFGPEAVICPGLMDLFSSPGASGHAAETAEVVDPDADPRDVLDPNHRDFRLALEAGITSVMVAPVAANLVNGVCLTVRTHVAHGQLDVLRDEGPMLFAFGEGVWRSDRAPTSRVGTLQLFRETLAKARDGAAHPRVNAAVAGQLDALIVCPSRTDLVMVQQALGDAGRHFGLVHTVDAIDLAEDLQGLRPLVVVGPYTLESSPRVLRGAAALARAGIEVAFRGGFPGAPADALRMTAALAVRHGMQPAAARRAITTGPARIAGVADHVGVIAPGKDADLVVFSHDPLRMDARVLEVYIRGVRVYAAEHQEMSLAGAQQ